VKKSRWILASSVKICNFSLSWTRKELASLIWEHNCRGFVWCWLFFSLSPHPAVMSYGVACTVMSLRLPFQPNSKTTSIEHPLIRTGWLWMAGNWVLCVELWLQGWLSISVGWEHGYVSASSRFSPIHWVSLKCNKQIKMQSHLT
jgi:hypothetical protein